MAKMTDHQTGGNDAACPPDAGACLDAAYRATTYRLFLPGGLIDLRIGLASDDLRCWLETAGSDCFAIITAWNPGSKPASETVNAEHQARLECDLLEGNYEPYAAQNLPDADDAPVEESCFVPDLAEEDAVALAADYGQNAIVCGGADGVPRLVWVEAPAA